MSMEKSAPMPSSRFAARPLALSLTVGAVAANIASLIVLFFRNDWLVDAQGRPIFTDFVAIFVAGREALSGSALAAYDGRFHHAAELAFVGHSFQGFLGWPYPPSYLFVAALLALF